MKIALFSDIHGNLQALDSVLNDINDKKIDLIISLGDVIGLGPSSKECIKKIDTLKNIIKISGNHELYYTKGIEKKNVPEHIIDYNKWLHKNLSCKIDDSKLYYLIEHNNKKLYFTHFFTNEDTYPFYSSHIFDTDEYKKVLNKFNYDYVFYGHTHKERIDKIDNNTYYGVDSSGCTKDDKTFYYIIDLYDKITIEKITLKYDRKTFEKTLNSLDFPDKQHISKFFFGIKSAK